MKIALVHDYLKEYGGAERVLQALHEIWPQAPIYTIFYKKNSPAGKAFTKAKIVQSWFGYLPAADKLISPLRFLIPLIWKSFDFSGYDLVISSASWAITKGFASEKTKEICYCHTPPRYLYGYETSKNWQKNPLIRIYALVVNFFMRQYDFRQAQKVTIFVANSREVQKRIAKFYRRKAKIISPPVEIPRVSISFHPGGVNRKVYFLAGGRLERAKNFDLIIRAFNKLGWPLLIYGRGSQEKYLRGLAKKNIKFLGWVSEEEKWKLLTGCKAFVCAAEDEDFGITPVEAQAAGRPVIAFRGGGYLETVVEGKTGVFFDKLTVEDLIKEIKKLRNSEIKPEDCRRWAKNFSKERFKKEMIELVRRIYAGTT
ncbi:MAG: glycosyltransferase [Microgenomates group bacterium]